MTLDFIPYAKQSIDQSDIDAVIKSLSNDIITSGAIVNRFEMEFAEVVGSKYAVAVCNGTAALHLAYISYGLTRHNNIVTTPFTFAATSNAALYCGATPKFCDVNSMTGNLDLDLLGEQSLLSGDIVVPVHLGGNPCDMSQIKKYTSGKKIGVIEDACHALGAVYAGNRVGSCSHSDMAVFSFHPVKHITTGEGGMITTNDKELYQKLLLLRTHGIVTDTVRYWDKKMIALGYNYRMTEFQAALGLSQLSRLDSFLRRREIIASYYHESFSKLLSIGLFQTTEGCKNSYHLFRILLDTEIDREEFMNYMNKKGIGVQIHYPLITDHPFYKDNYGTISPVNAKNLSSRTVSLPMYPELTDEQVEKVVNAVSCFISNYA